MFNLDTISSELKNEKVHYLDQQATIESLKNDIKNFQYQLKLKSYDVEELSGKASISQKFHFGRKTEAEFRF